MPAAQPQLSGPSPTDNERRAEVDVHHEGAEHLQRAVSPNYLAAVQEALGELSTPRLLRLSRKRRNQKLSMLMPNAGLW